MREKPKEIYPVTASFLPDDFTWPKQKDLPALLSGIVDEHRLVPFIADLAAVEWAIFTVGLKQPASLETLEKKCVNPTLELLPVDWSGLPELLQGGGSEPLRQKSYVAVYLTVKHDIPKVVAVSGHELLAMKIVAEERDKREVAITGKTSVSMINTILHEGKTKELIYWPPSKIKREQIQGNATSTSCDEMAAEVFAFQWHLTQKCDLHCRHCYDRSNREEMTPEQAIYALDCMYEFCEQYNVTGQVSFSGGNPLLYPHFEEVYREAVERGFMTAILGNPTSRRSMERLLHIRHPEYYQVSLEGLQIHNDYIRGPGHFERVMEFLDLLRELGVYSMVMLTLTRDNMNDVIPLANLLSDRVDLFNFNRLSSVGEGTALESVPVSEYAGFLLKYREAARKNTIMGSKDNLFNILQDRDDMPLTGGCTGFGCGAAFNFVSLLPDGEIHACRKFPSYIGNIREGSIVDAYQSEIAQKYRKGSLGCNDCRIRHFCGGCAAVVYGFGGDVFSAVDPYCFIHPK